MSTNEGSIPICEIEKQIQQAQANYDKAKAELYEAENQARNSFFEHGQANYWRGRQCALKDLLETLNVETAPSENPTQLLDDQHGTLDDQHRTLQTPTP